MNTPIRFALAAIATAGFLSGCNKTVDSLLPVGDLRVVNAVSDSQPMDATVATLPGDFNNVAFGSGTGFRTEPIGSYKVQLTLQQGSSSPVTVTANNVSIDAGKKSTVFAIGQLGNSSTSSLFLENPDQAIPGSSAEVQFVDVAAITPASVDIYLISPASGLSGASPVATTSYPNALTPQTVTPGSYEIVITAQGNPTTVYFDSGATGITIAGGSSQQIALLDEANTATAGTMSLLFLDNTGQNYRSIPSI